VMYTTGSGNPATVTAIDARSGRQIWRWTRQQKIVNPYEINPFARGVAILGNRIFLGTLDGALVAVDARTGQTLWEQQVVDTMEGSSITSPPLVLKDMVITGMTGGEYATRGHLDAYDAATGKRKWRFYTIPAPGEPGNETWKGDSWKTGGGPTWLTGSFDPALNLVYWAVGNPAPEFDRVARGEMDNLYSNSVVALDADTGTLKWHYQFTPDDGHDWDSVQDMVLVDRVWRGEPRKLLMHADRNGHFYVLDRTNGKFLSGTPFIYQNWNSGFTPNGRPQPIPGSNSTEKGSFLVYPTLGGGTNFQAPSYSPATGWFYLAFGEGGQVYVSTPQQITRGQQYLGRGRAAGPPPARGPNQPATNAGIKAIDPETGKTVWSHPIFQGSLTNGVLATGGNVVFASSRDGNILALDGKTGKYLWHFQTGGNHQASPMSYAVDGKQYVALAAGNVVFSFTLQE
jgi:PQQ-dependent dehydrogenase (methanol/ethanol family)